MMKDQAVDTVLSIGIRYVFGVAGTEDFCLLI